MSDVIGKFSFLKENQNFKRYRECDFFLDSSIKSRNKITVKKNSDIPISLKYDSQEKTSNPTIILFYFNSTPKEIKEDWENIPSTFRDGVEWKTKNSINNKDTKIIIKQEDISFNFGFVNLDYEQKLYETFKKIDKFSPFHWAKIRNKEKSHFILFYNKLYPQYFMEGDILKMYEYFVKSDHGAILEFKIKKSGTVKYEKGTSYDLVSCIGTEKGTCGKIKILKLIEKDFGIISENKYNFDILNSGKKYKSGTSWILSGGSPGGSPAIFFIKSVLTEGEILDFNVLKTGTDKYKKGSSYGICSIGHETGKFGKFKILNLKEDNEPDIVTDKNFNFKLINRGKDYIEGTCYCLSGGTSGLCPAVFEILKTFKGGKGKGNKNILDFEILKTGENLYNIGTTYGLSPMGDENGTSGEFKILNLSDNNNPGIISSAKYDFDIINRGNQYEKGCSYYLTGGVSSTGAPGTSPAIFQITNVSRLEWKGKKGTDNSHRTKKFRIHTNHVTFNEGFFQYIGTSAGISVTVFKYGETKKSYFEGEYKFQENDIFESIGVSSGLCYSNYTGVSAGLIYFAGVCRDINKGTSVFYIHGTSLMYSKFKKIEFEKEKSEKSDIYRQIKKLEGRAGRKYQENLTIKEEDMDDSLKKYLKGQL